MPAAHKKIVSFSEYKEMSDEIKSYFKPEFERIHDRFDSMKSAIETKFDAVDRRFDSLKKRMTFITWFLPFFITLLVAIMTILNFVMK